MWFNNCTSPQPGVTVELYMIQSVPLTEINKTHTAIANIGMNSYTVSMSTNASISKTQQLLMLAG